VVINATSYQLFRSTTQLEIGLQVYSGTALNFDDSLQAPGSYIIIASKHAMMKGAAMPAITIQGIVKP